MDVLCDIFATLVKKLTENQYCSLNNSQNPHVHSPAPSLTLAPTNNTNSGDSDFLRETRPAVDGPVRG